MSDSILEEVNDACKHAKLSGLSETKAPGVLAGELTRLKRVIRLRDILVKMNSEFPERKAKLEARAAELRAEISRENAENVKRDEKIRALNKRGDELREKSASLMEILKVRSRHFQLGKFQREELWNLILRMAELVNGINQNRPEISRSIDGQHRQSEADVLEVLVRTNSDRIMQLESQLSHIALEISEIESRNKDI